MLLVGGVEQRRERRELLDALVRARLRERGKVVIEYFFRSEEGEIDLRGGSAKQRSATLNP